MPYRCPLCQKTCGSDLKQYVDHVEGEIVALIQADHPEWVEGGVCKKCYEYYKAQLKGE